MRKLGEKTVSNKLLVLCVQVFIYLDVMFYQNNKGKIRSKLYNRQQSTFNMLFCLSPGFKIYDSGL